MTALGAIHVERSHGYCNACHLPQFPADRLLGIKGWLTPRARGMSDRAGIADPFRQAEGLLFDLAGWTIDAETIRRYCHEDAQAAREGRDERQALPEQFAAAPGDRELQIDAGKVNTPEGWRDVKVAVFACRSRAEPATSEDYQQRDLPPPSVRSVVAEIEEAKEFGKRCVTEALRLGVEAEELSALGDGGEWIWNLVALYFAAVAACVLDVYHGVEHLADVGRAAFGEEGERMKEWLEGARLKLVADGYCGACEAIAQLCADAEVAKRAGQAAAEALNYFGGNRERMGYAVRLLRGQAIGSGMVEGTIKQRVNVRMKRSGARWLAEHVGPFVELMATADSPEWAEHLAALAS
jgi:hypothetical protein